METQQLAESIVYIKGKVPAIDGKQKRASPSKQNALTYIKEKSASNVPILLKLKNKVKSSSSNRKKKKFATNQFPKTDDKWKY